MDILLFPLNYPCVYIAIAFFVCVFHGIQRAFIMKHVLLNENLKLKKERLKKWDEEERLFLHCLPSFLCNFVCSFAGFVAFFVVCKMFQKIKDYATIGWGPAILLIFLIIVSIVGITGNFYHCKEGRPDDK